MTLSEFRLSRLTQAAKNANADLMVASLPANIMYISGFRSVPMEVLARTQTYALFSPESGKIRMVASIAELPSIVESMGMDADVFCYGAFRFTGLEGEALTDLLAEAEAKRNYASAEEALAAAIRDSGARNVALDENHISHPSWLKVESFCPGVTLFPGAEVFMRARMKKHPEEIAGLERSAEIAEIALAAALKDFRPGMTELDMEYAYNCELTRHGASPYFFVATAAKRAAYADTTNTPLAVQVGDMIRFDFGCMYQGYCSDLARTAVLGQPDEKIASRYHAVACGTREAIAAIRPGVTTAEEVFEIAMRETRANGLPNYNRHHCGHGIGVECYDFPSIAKGDKTVLEPGMTMCIETPFYELGWGGVQIEDTIVVEENGARCLDKSGDALIVLEVKE